MINVASIVNGNVLCQSGQRTSLLSVLTSGKLIVYNRFIDSDQIVILMFN